MLDLDSRGVVGWSMGTSSASRLVVDALHRALVQRGPIEGLVAYPSLGSQYVNDRSRLALCQHGVTCRMSHAGTCDDNAPMESFVPV